MYFYLENGKQCLDLKGTLILSFNDELVKARVKSAGPKTIKAPDGYIKNVGKAKFFNRVFITLRVIAFIWGRDKQLKREDTNFRESHRANVVNLHDNKCDKNYPDKSNCPYNNGKNGLSCECNK